MANKKNASTIGIKVVPAAKVQGVYKYSKSDWTLVSYIIPRNKLDSTFVEAGLQNNCVYILIGREGITDKAYVGQAKERNSGGSVLKRLREHNDSETESYRDLWDYAVVITSSNGDWGATELNALEYILYNEIPESKRLNSQEPNHGGFGTEIDYEEKVRQVKTFFKFMGIDIFENTDDVEEIQFLQVEETEDTAVAEDLRYGFGRIAEIITPRKEVVKMVNEIPDFMFNPTTTFFDMAVKGGEYLKEIYNRLMVSEYMISYFPDPIVRATHIFDKQLFGVALSSESLERANRSLYGYPDANKNIKDLDFYIYHLKNGSANEFINYIKEEFGVMTFNVVIGNPPYNDIKNGGGTESMQNSKQLYTYFVDRGIELTSNILELIIPCRWYTEMDKEYVKMRDTLSDGHLKKIVDYPDSSEVFKEVSVVGGVCYFVYDKVYDGLCEFVSFKENKSGEIDFKNTSIIIRYKEIRDIVNKVKEKAEKTLDTTAGTTAPFGFKRNFRGLINKTENNYIKLISADKDVTYVGLEDITKNKELVSKYNVYVGYTQSLNEGVISSLGILKPDEVCTLTYFILNNFDSYEEAENCMKYIKTKFARCLIKAITSTLGVTAKNYSLVPLQNFTSVSDINWSQSISDIDQQLYRKYNLTEEEMNFIESIIAPM
ncbi:MAG: Eco57I restriction-modification methylase domain-containing protein [Lachnospiraceae bacterium]|nr:Eco57I restriction-modification methylase domain-containing protein [Lachnospiraceae bacterium]